MTTSGTPRPIALSPFTQTTTSVALTTLGSSYFDGTGDYLTIPSNAAFAFGTGNFTIEAWVNISSYAGAPGIFDTRTTGNEATGVIFNINASGMLTIYNSAALVTSSTALTINSWNHVVAVRTGTGANQTTIYLNGIAVVVGTYDLVLTSAVSAGIGALTAGTAPFNGYIDDFRITKGYARYTANFFVPIADFPLW